MQYFQYIPGREAPCKANGEDYRLLLIVVDDAFVADIADELLDCLIEDHQALTPSEQVTQRLSYFNHAQVVTQTYILGGIDLKEICTPEEIAVLKAPLIHQPEIEQW